MADDTDLTALARQTGKALQAARKVMVSAESCTGGWIAKCMTDIAGSSAWFERGFVTYSNAAKTDMLGVPAATLEAHGAVSEATVRAMATGALELSGASVAVAVSGIAGPGGGSPDKPVGTVWFAWAQRSADGVKVSARQRLFSGDREAVRRRCVAVALIGVRDITDS